jgi:hypothetical protein
MMKGEGREMTTRFDLPKSLRERLRLRARSTNQSEEQIVCAALEAYLAVPLPLREEMQAWQAAGAEAVEAVAPISDEAW